MKKILLRKTIILTLSVVLTVAITVLLSKMPLTERERFEIFLVNEYQKVPCMSEGELSGIPGPTRPDLAAYQNFFMTLDPVTGKVPADRLKAAYETTREIEKSAVSALRSEIYWQSTGATMGGRTRAIMFDPNDDEHKKVWAGGVTGGLWFNNDITDQGSEWVPIDDFWASLSVSSIASDPNSPNVIYVGTGEAPTAIITYRESSGVGMGIYKTANGGNNWYLLPATEEFRYVTDIVVRDEDGISVVYAGVASGNYHGEIHQSEPTDGLYRSFDGGASWEQVLPDMPGYGYPYTVNDIALGADNKLYAGTMQNVNGNGGAVILMSDNGTAGSWTVYDDYNEIIQNSSYPLPGRVALTTSPNNPGVVYAALGAGFTDGFPYYYGRYILKTEDHGTTWNTINKPNSNGNWANLAWHALTACVNPENPDVLYVGGLDVWRTTNQGQSWKQCSDWSAWGSSPDYVHADQHNQLYRPGTSDEMVFTTDGGVFYTANALANNPVFVEMNNNYNTLQFYTCDISPVTGEERFLGGLQDNGTLYYTGTPLSVNNMVMGGDGAYCFFDKNQPQYMLTSYYYNRYYVFDENNVINYISDYQSGIFINPADYDSENNALYANAVSFWQSNPNRILRVKNVTGNFTGEYVYVGTAVPTWFSNVTISPHSPSGTVTLFLGSNSGRLYKVTNAQDTPQTSEIGSEDFPLGSISSVAVGNSENTLLVTFSNYGVSSVWQTLDGGETWSEKEGNLPDMPVRWAIYHPENDGQAMLATETGIWETNQLQRPATQWYPATNGMANVRVDMLKIRETDNTVIAASHGRGLFWAQYPLDPFVDINEMVMAEKCVFPNPASTFINVRVHSASGQIKITDISGKIFCNTTFNSNPVGLLKVDISGYPAGLYFIRLEEENTVYTDKFIVH